MNRRDHAQVTVFFALMVPVFVAVVGLALHEEATEVDRDVQPTSNSGMRPVAAVGLVLAILMLVLGSGWLLRQSGSRQTQPGLSPTVQAARPTPPTEGVVAPDATMSA